MKYCANCGSSMEDAAAFCPNCGAAAEVIPVDAAAPASNTYTAPVQNSAAQDAASKTAMILAIVGCALGCLWFTSLIGIIISAIARGKVKAATAMGATGGKLKAANIISRIGLIVSIVMFILLIIYAVCMGLLIGYSAGSSYYYY